MKRKLEYTAKGTSLAWAPVAEYFSDAPHSNAIQEFGTADVLSGLEGWKPEKVMSNNIDNQNHYRELKQTRRRRKRERHLKM